MKVQIMTIVRPMSVVAEYCLERLSDGELIGGDGGCVEDVWRRGEVFVGSSGVESE